MRGMAAIGLQIAGPKIMAAGVGTTATGIVTDPQAATSNKRRESLAPFFMRGPAAMRTPV